MTDKAEEYNGMLVKRERLKDPSPHIALYLVTYISQGLKVKGYLVIPEHTTPCRALLYCRGGIGRVGMVRVERIVSLSKRGYVVFAPFYRGNAGGEGKDFFGGDDRYDVFYAIPFIQSLAEVNQESIVAFGFSRGAIMALLAARECPEIGPVIVWGGVSDLTLTYEERVDLRRMLKRVVGHPFKQPEEYRKRSPIYWIEEIHNPIMLIHGTHDEKVGVEHAMRLSNELEKNKKNYDIQLFEGLGHTFSKELDDKALDMIFQWIQKQDFCYN